MSIVIARKEVFLQERQDKLDGILNGIPLYYTFPKLASVVSTIPRGYPMLLTAGSGVGKTQSWIGIFIYTIYKLRKLHPELNFKIKLVISLLEDTKEMFIDRLYSMLFYDMFQEVVSYEDLHSMKSGALSEENIKRLDLIEKEIEFILDECEINDSVYNVTGCYKWARNISNKLGKHHTKELVFGNENGTSEVKTVYSHYTPNDPDQQVLFILDNLNNLSAERRGDKLMTERETLNCWTRDYVRLQMTKHWKWSCLSIIQQAAESEKKQYTRDGENVLEKNKPSLDNLGNSKEVQRDSLLVFGLFAPYRFSANTYKGYNISTLKDNFRSLIILKSNLSVTNVEIPFYFNGACSLLRELPAATEMTNFKL